MAKYACWQVYSNEQDENRQLKSFAECGEEIDKIFGDKMSGKNMDRPDYQRMIAKLEPGDLVIFSSLDCMSRSYDDIAKEWRLITKEKGCDILILDMADLLDTRKGKDLVGTLISDIVVKLLSYVAETERKNTVRRLAEGRAAMSVDEEGYKVSKKTGRRLGRPNINPNLQLVDGETVTAACKRLGISRTTYYRKVACPAEMPVDEEGRKRGKTTGCYLGRPRMELDLELLDGETVTAACKRLGISTKTYYRKMRERGAP